MSKYVDIDELIVIGLDDPDCEHQFKFVPWEFIEDAPTADVVEVIRCKDCNWKESCRTTNVWAVPPSDDWFCADGVRRTE